MKVSTALETAVQHHGAGRLDEAEKLYDAVLGALPDHADALHLRGILACQQGALDHAADLIARAIAVNGGEADYHNSLGNVRQLQGDYRGAEASLRRALSLRPDYPQASINLGIALYGSGNAAEAVAMLHQGIARLPNHAQARAALGLIAFEAGDFVTAAAQMKIAASQEPRFAYGASCVFGDELTAWTDPAGVDALLAAAPDLSGEMPDAGRPGMVVTSACDHGYFRKYARPLAISLDRNAPGHDLHLHLFNPEPDFDTELAHLKSCLDNTRLTVSREAMPGADALYFSNMRFARLHQIMAACGRDLFSLDTDSLIRGPLDDLGSAVGDADLAFILRPEKAEIGHKILATSIYFTASPAARDFLAHVAGYILSCVRDKRLAWYLDQSVLYLVYRMMTRDGATLETAPLPTEYADSAFTADSAVWAAKGDRKTEPVFLAEAAKFTPKD